MAEEKTLVGCCLCCCFDSEPLNMECRIPVSGYTPGQTIKVLITVSNKSSLDVERLDVLLIKVRSKG